MSNNIRFSKLPGLLPVII